jgi:prepilin-type N-terminal cleavage/methylation domain-containing protein
LRRHAGRRREGFTLVELLLVVAILGIVIAAVVPRLGGLLEGGQVAVAARAVAQAGRYARSMALLHQMPLDLVLRLDGAELRVEAAAAQAPDSPAAGGLWLSGGGMRDATGDPSETATPAGGAGFGPALSRNERLDALTGLGLRSAASAADAADLPPEDEGGLREELALHRPLAGVALEFLGYLDRTDASFPEPLEQGIVRVRYRANGACRPYRVAVVGVRTGERFLVSVDAVGTPRLVHGDGAGRSGR